MFVQTTREAIAELYNAGLTQPAIARQLDLAPTTVSYHVERLINGRDSDLVAAHDPPEPVVSQSKTRIAVAGMLAQGISRAEVARRLGISKPTVSYHARRLGHTIHESCSRRYDWDAVQRYYDHGHSVRECMKAFGFSSSSWSDAVKRGALVSRPGATPISALLADGTYRGRKNVKLRLIKAGLKECRCERCGLVDWRGEPLTLAPHHINGKRNDNRLENLELLCPNCHSQTNNFGGRNGLTRPELVSE
jgi:DNA-binding CsgD family transcriptional regulator/Zn finger protein HypA/HybF involved in hydrogenase expression